MRGSAGSSPSARLPAGRRDAVVVEHVADPNGRTETQLGMAFAEVLGHRRRLGVADALHQHEHRSASTRPQTWRRRRARTQATRRLGVMVGRGRHGDRPGRARCRCGWGSRTTQTDSLFEVTASSGRSLMKTERIRDPDRAFPAS